MVAAAELLLRDRFAEFQQLALNKGGLPSDNVSNTVSNGGVWVGREALGRVRLLQPRTTSGTVPPVAPAPDFMRDFFKAISDIQGMLQQGRDGVATMGKMLEDALQATTQAGQAAVSERLSQLVEETNGHVARAKQALVALEKVDADERLPRDSAEGRIRANMRQAMARKHQQLLLDFQRAQLDFKQMLERQKAREMQLVCPEASEQEVQEMIEAGETSSQLVMRRMAGAHAMILDEVQRIRDKHSDIMRLEQSIQDLAQMFQEMAVLVDAQGELLDAIEVHVNNTSEYTSKAVKELESAKKLQRNTRKWMCYLSVFLAIVVMVILGPLLLRYS